MTPNDPAATHPSEHERLDAEYDTRPDVDRRGLDMLKRGVKRRAQRGLRRTLALVGWLTRTDPSSGAELRSGNPAIRRILVVRVDLIGDVVLSLPAVRALRRAYPDATIDMLTLRSTAAILAGERDDIARVLTFDPSAWRWPVGLLRVRPWRDALTLLKDLRAAKYDLAISVSGDIGSILTRLSGAPRRVGYADEAYGSFLTDTLPGGRYQRRQHEVRYVLALAERAGGDVQPGNDLLTLHVVPEAAAQVRAILEDARARLKRSGPTVALHTGARNGQAKRWPPEQFAALAQRLARDLDALVLLVGGPTEQALARAVTALCDAPLVDLVGNTSLPELVALLHDCDLLVTGDSGPMHIACAVRTPVVALHGPTDPGLSGPTDPSALILWRRLWCAPCYDASATAECRFGNPVCMKSLGPDLVYSAVRRQLIRHGGLCASAEGLPHVASARR